MGKWVSDGNTMDLKTLLIPTSPGLRKVVLKRWDFSTGEPQDLYTYAPQRTGGIFLGS